MADQCALPPSPHRTRSARSFVRRFALVAVLATSSPFLAALGAPAAHAAVPAGAGVHSGPAHLVAIGAAPEAPLGSRAVGAVPAAAHEAGGVVLKPRDDAALVRYIAAATTKGSASFHHYLARGQFASTFGPSRATLGAVQSWLRGDGLVVGAPTAGGLLVPFSGSAAAAESAFATGLTRYALPDGRAGQATTSAVHVPSSIAGAVTAVVGLDNLVSAHSSAIRRPTGGGPGALGHKPAAGPTFTHPAGSPDACPDAQAAAQEYGGLTDDQIANAYGAFGLYSVGDFAATQHIAVYELEPFLPSDVNTFDTCYFGASEAATMATDLHVIPVDGGQPTGPGGGEAVLDVEDVSAVAPGATIDVYEAPNTNFGGLDEYAQIVSADTDQVVTSSWGLCEQAVQLAEPGVQQSEDYIFQEAAAQGQSVFNAAGDTGSDACNAYREPTPPPDQNPLSVSDPASQPYVVAVGGTTIDDATQPPLERVWNDGPEWGAGGGGISMSWEAPAWQSGAQVSGIPMPSGSDYANANVVESEYGWPTNFCQAYLTQATATTPCRAVPDVSAQADEFTGAVTIYGADFGGWFTIGGTSSATPLWAAMVALVNDSATCTGNDLTANGVGFVSPLLYAVASNPTADSASFNDITTGNNDDYALDNGLVFPARAGYDLASGLGSPQLTGSGGSPGLAYYLCSYAVAATRPGVTSVSPPAAPVAGGTTLTVNGANFEQGSTPDVASVNIGTWQADPTTISVSSTNQLTVTLPPAVDTLAPDAPAPLDGAGAAAVTVTLTDGETSAPGPSSIFQYEDQSPAPAPIPSVSGVSPYGGNETAPTPVTIYGGGFTGATGVTFGGVAATSFTVVSDSEITATPAAYTPSTTCAPNLPGENPVKDVCQVEVVVTNANGSSKQATIDPPYEGAALPIGPMGVPTPPAGTEVMPAPTEFDYVPSPIIKSVSTTGGPLSLAAETGGSVIMITGKGFDPLTFDWADFGDPSQEFSQFTEILFQKGDKLQLVDPGLPVDEPFTTDTTTSPFSVKTLAGQSAQAELTYAGFPMTNGVATATGAKAGAPDTGGTPIVLTGAGFANQVTQVIFADVATPYSFGVQNVFSNSGDTTLDTDTVAQNPALVDVMACTVSGCESNYPSDVFTLYPPGNPVVDSVSPTGGPAQGGTQVTITGENLGCVTGVFFGSVAAETFSNAQAILDCGSTSTVTVTAPPSVRGSVPVTATTVESDITDSGPSSTSANFTYALSAPSAPTNLSVTPGPASATVSWGAPLVTGGDAITSYTVQATSAARTVVMTEPAGTTHATFATLAPGVAWFFTVTANSAAGAGLPAGSDQFTLGAGDNGYLVATANGAVLGFGSLSSLGGVGGQTLPGAIAGVAATADGLGYWLVGATGAEYAIGDAPDDGGSPALPSGTKAVGIAAAPNGLGYWIVTNKGNVYNKGAATWYGSEANKTIPAPIVGMVATPDGGGYWLVTSAGNVYNFGDAVWYGSMVGKTLPAPVVAIIPTPDGHGYWLVTSAGNVFNFGDAVWYGSLAGKKLSAPIVGAEVTPDGHGYWLVGSDGAVYAFGSAIYEGNSKGMAQSAAVGITA